LNDLPADRWDGLEAAELAGRWGAPGVHLFSRVGSTNDIARRLAAEGAPAGTVVVADEQLRGRGRAGRCWASPPGLGLWFSVVGAAGAAAGVLPLVVGVTVAQALDTFLDGVEVEIKWPNDLYFVGRKLGGILCEGSWEGGRRGAVVVGVGLNLLQEMADFPAEVREGATSLRLGGAAPFSRSAVAAQVVGAVVGIARGGAPLDIEALARKDLLRGEHVRVTDPVTGAELSIGTAAGIAPDGALRIREASGRVREVRSGTVRAGDRL
jgi:BirA family transcriptional regulator, biotin operon repressor / biotin---[acetyl-CoA-carboxylase] ligase